VLERLGLLEAIAGRAARIERLHAVTHRGKTLINLAYGDVERGMCAYGVHRGELFSVLHEWAVARGAKIRLNRRITGFNERPEGIEVLDERGISQGRFDLLLGADGSRSELRRASRLRAQVYDYPHGALWAQGPCAAVRGELWQVTRGTQQMCGLLPMGGERCALFWSLEKSGKHALFAEGFETWKQEGERWHRGRRNCSRV
jgi:2-polyprenyl-6-methoxyphenol hydroxylase-like FAD-dependent oxidoreductase